MEKRIAHYPLPDVRRLVSEGRVRATGSAMNGALELGIESLSGICDVVLSLTTKCFYKSMTSHGDHRIWQDVYHGTTPFGDSPYLKLTVVGDVLIVSFKELEL